MLFFAPSSASGAGTQACQLKVGLRTPTPPMAGESLPLRRVRDKMRKQALKMPRMITPEMSKLVTVFIWKAGALRFAAAVETEKKVNQ